MTRVLIADDNHDNLYLLKVILEGHGFEVDQASNGAEALRVALQRPPGLIIADLLMPVMDGYSLLRRWQANESLRPIPFIVYTATYTDPQDEKLALEMGADAFLVKPAEPDKILGCIKDQLAAVHSADPMTRSANEEAALFDEYSASVVRKLEEKTAQLQQANRDLLNEIEERRQAETREREMASRLTETLEIINDGFVTLNQIWRFTFVNRQAEKLLAQSRQQLLGQDLWERLPEMLGTEFEHEFRRAMETRRMSRFEAYFPPLDGWLDVRAYPSEEGLTICLQDVTKIHRSQEALKQSEANFREMAENIEEVFYNFDPVEGKLLYVSPAFEAVWGRPREEIFADPMDYLNTVLPEDRPVADEALRRQLEGEATDTEFRIRRPDGSIRWVKERSYPLRDGDGQLSRIVGAFKDISDSRIATEQLQVSEERFRLLSRASRDAIWDWNVRTGEMWFNDGFEMLFGYTGDDNEASFEAWSERIHPDDFDRIVPDIRGRIDQGDAQWSSEYRYRRHDNRYATVLDRGYVIRDQDGKAVRMIGGMADITEKKELEKRLLQSQKMEAIGHLAGGVAHDFNNLLTVINGYSDIIMDLLPADEPARPMVFEIRQAGDRAAGLTRQLLAFSRQQVLVPQVLDLNEVIKNIENLIARLLGEDIRVSTVLQARLASIKVDPGQLEQVIMNLAVNARDAMPRGGQLTIESREVELGPADIPAESELEPGWYVELAVADNGCGMPPEVRSRVFDPFFTTKGPGRGTGLGLSTAFGIVKQSGGYIDVESELEIGTRFRVLFPAIGCQIKSLTPESSSLAKGHESILLVEDEEAIRGVAKIALQSQGYHVIEAVDGREAIKILGQRTTSIDLLLTDVVMPEIGGRELVRYVRGQHPDIKVIYMSGYTDDANLRDDVISAADGYVQKPFSPLTLGRKIREVLDETPQSTR